MKSKFAIEDITACTDPNVWDIGNNVLYDLCKQYPHHNDTRQIVAKVWLIGRSYAAALERRRNKAEINDIFYSDNIASAFKQSDLDQRLFELTSAQADGDENFIKCMYIHKELIDVLHVPTKQHKRSFSSKYLHFHCPENFYIYDSRATEAIRTFNIILTKEMLGQINSMKMDEGYAKFAFICRILKSLIKNETEVSLTNRQLDNLLVAVANKKLTGLLEKKMFPET